MRLVKFNKTECGVDFLMKVGSPKDLVGDMSDTTPFRSDLFEVFFFRKASGSIVIKDKEIELRDNMILVVSPFMRRQWKLSPDTLDYRFVFFQEDFINELISDKYFVYRLLYSYPTSTPPVLEISAGEMEGYFSYIDGMIEEQTHPVADSYHMLLSSLYSLLLRINRRYAKEYNLPFNVPKNNYAYKFKQLLELHVAKNLTVNEYAELVGVSRICLNKSVKEQFGVTAREMIQHRMLDEIKNMLLYSGLSVKEISFQFHFSEPNHLMRFFKSQTGQTIGEFLDGYQIGRNE